VSGNHPIPTPFLSAVIKVLDTMAFCESTPGKPFLRPAGGPLTGDVAGVVGVTGNVCGSLALSESSYFTDRLQYIGRII